MDRINRVNLTEEWDWIILTASNKKQAITYEKEIESRVEKGIISKKTRCIVLEDPDGKRIGSGGATLNVLKEIKGRCTEKELEKAKILLIHSGGDSKRIPQYSVQGKIFSPIQKELEDGSIFTLFDEFIMSFSTVPERMSPGMIILSGDVLLMFNPLQINLNSSDSIAISIKSPVEIGKNHGVFLTDKDGQVKQFLHKKSVEVLKKLNAVDEDGNVDIDTGAIYFSSKILNQLISLISTNNKIDMKKYNYFVNDNVRLNFYGDFLYPLANKSTYDSYLKEPGEVLLNEDLITCRKQIWDKLNKFSIKVIKLSPANFIHYGTTKELLNLLTNDFNNYKSFNWSNNVFCNIYEDINYVVNHSYISNNAKISKNVYIENSYIGDNVSIGNNVILSNVIISNCNIPDNVCINTVLTKSNEYVTRIYAIDDNPKSEKLNKTKFLNSYLEDMMNKYDIPEDEIWDNDKSIWKANLYTIEKNNDDSIKSALLFDKIIKCKATKKEAKQYFNKKRASLFSSFNNANIDILKERNEILDLMIRSYKFIYLIGKQKEEINVAKEILLQNKNVDKQVDMLITISEKLDSMTKARVFLTISKILKEKGLESNYEYNFEDKCYEEIKNMIIRSKSNKIRKEKINDISYVELPIRINFGGGWSDTPPYCIENGGTVINGAFKLNQENSVRVKIEKNNNKAIILNSIDLNVHKEIKDIDELKNYADTKDDLSIIKVALIIAGIVKDTDNSIEDVIERIGTGFNFTTYVKSIPKGSGLGTSSILSSACIKAIFNFIGTDLTEEELINKTLEQEQIMGTGGGWQDQIGAIIPGIKCIHTEAGKIQKFRIDKIKLSKKMQKEINDRFALIYTGQRRLAKNLLRDIMGKYISNNPIVIETIKEIKEIAIEMENSLKEENLDEFCRLLNKHWILSKKLDSGCSNTCIEQILKSCEDLTDGHMICGAGGGGFLQVILKRGVSKQKLAKKIKEVFKDTKIEVYDISIYMGE